MSKYTTGEIAKICNVSVRTVQYYDSREILMPSELSDGGRRLYSENDLKKMKVICYLREIGFSINDVKKLLSESNSKKVISFIVKRQKEVLESEILEKKTQLNRVESLLEGLTNTDNFSLEKICDMANVMEDKKALRKVRFNMIWQGILIDLFQIASIVLWAVKGIWIPFAIVMPIVIVWAILVSRYYFKKVNYICPECGAIFKPKFKSAFFANHTPNTRKLTCPNCGKKSFCFETAKKPTV